MRDGWLYAGQLDRVLGLCVVLLFVVAEALVVAASLGSPQARSPAGLGLLLARMLINAIPAAAGLKGYFVAKRLPSRADAKQKDAVVLWVSRQFLATAAFAYGAVIFDVIHLGNAIGPR